MKKSYQQIINRYIINFKYAFNWKKPLLLWRLVWTYVGIIFFKKKPLRYVDFALDFSCNQSCTHCFALTYDHQKTLGRKKISNNEYSKIIREALDLGAVSFSIQGGEPLLTYADLKNLISLIPVEKVVLSIKTNGTLLTLEKAYELKKMGVDIVTISLDSGIAQEHDQFRGQSGAHTLATAGIEHAHQAGLKVIVACTLGHLNVGSSGVIKLINDTRNWGVLMFLNLAAPSGKWEGNKEILLRPEDRVWIDQVLADYPHCRTDFSANYVHSGCGALKEIIYIDQYANVMPCPFIQINLGNAREESLDIIRQRGLKAAYFSQYPQQCIIAEDRNFIDHYVYATTSKEKLPIPIADKDVKFLFKRVK